MSNATLSAPSARLLARVRPRGGWIAFVLTLLAASALPLSVVAAGWAPGAERLLVVGLLATCLGVYTGASRQPTRWSALSSFLAGILITSGSAGRIWPPIASILRELARGGTWLHHVASGRWDPQVPFLPLVPGVQTRALALVARLAAWLRTAQEGGTSQDNVVLILFLSWLTWMLCWFAGWRVYRHAQPLWAMLPCGTALVANVSAVEGTGWHLHVYLASTLLLSAMAGFRRREKAWDREGIDYSDQLRRDVALAGSLIVILVLTVSLIVPFFTSSGGIEFFWRHLGEPLDKLERSLDRLFSGRNRLPAGETHPRPGGHRLVGAVEVGEETVMYVTTSDPVPPPSDGVPGPEPEISVPQRYWRGITYDRYTGQGWENSGEQTRKGDAGAPLGLRVQAAEFVTQTYRLSDRNGVEVLGYAVNRPYVIHAPHTLHMRTPEDSFAYSLEAREYTVVSQVARHSVQQLRDAPSSPLGVDVRYTQLPSIPARVAGLAHEIAGGEGSAFDKATAVERYLRSFEYALDITAPPPDRDGVDYFLFDLRRGYCDYFATAMVVLCRTLGIPARYATGYASGSYDHELGAWVVRAEDAHAWAEVYVNDCGWLEFEPTPGRPTFPRFMEMPSGGLMLLQLHPGAQSVPVPKNRPTWLLWTLPALAALLAGVTLSRRAYEAHLQMQSPTGCVERLYANLVRWGSRAGMAPLAHQTPAEFVSYLGEGMEGLSGRRTTNVAGDLRRIGRAYVISVYAAHPVSRTEACLASRAWKRQRGTFWRVTVLRMLRPGAGVRTTS